MFYDVIVIGSGPAGITSSLYMKRAGLSVAIISNCKNSIGENYNIENYYGYEKPIFSKKLFENGIKQAENLKIDVIKKEVVGIKYIDRGFEIVTSNQGIDEKYTSKFIVIATGVNRNKVNIDGVARLEGRGVSYCAICDAPLYKGKNVAVLGNGEYAMTEVEELIPIARKVTLLTNGEKAIETRSEIEIKTNIIKEVRGNEFLEDIEYQNGIIERFDGLFIAEGIASSIDFAKKIGAKTNNNCIVVNDNMETSIENVYACGDCTGGILQISKAVYEGMISGLEIIKKYRNEKGINKNE